MPETTNPLGRHADFPTTVDPAILFPIARAEGRATLGLDAAALPFKGVDLWTAWELSWLDARGKPCIAVAELQVPCASPNLVESKSLKLYLNGYAMARFDNADAVRARIAQDVSACVGAHVGVGLLRRADFEELEVGEFAGEPLDDLQLDVADYAPPRADHLCARAGASVIRESLVTHAFRSCCPVTGQPDWASVQVRYRGRAIEHAGLLRYLVSFRDHPDFHEACVERMFVDIRQRCAPLELRVYARFLRRGGIDINPWRATSDLAAPVSRRSARQ